MNIKYASDKLHYHVNSQNFIYISHNQGPCLMERCKSSGFRRLFNVFINSVSSSNLVTLKYISALFLWLQNNMAILWNRISLKTPVNFIQYILIALLKATSFLKSVRSALPFISDSIKIK